MAERKASNNKPSSFLFTNNSVCKLPGVKIRAYYNPGPYCPGGLDNFNTVVYQVSTHVETLVVHYMRNSFMLQNWWRRDK